MPRISVLKGYRGQLQNADRHGIEHIYRQLIPDDRIRAPLPREDGQARSVVSDYLSQSIRDSRFRFWGGVGGGAGLAALIAFPSGYFAKGNIFRDTGEQLVGKTYLVEHIDQNDKINVDAETHKSSYIVLDIDDPRGSVPGDTDDVDFDIAIAGQNRTKEEMEELGEKLLHNKIKINRKPRFVYAPDGGNRVYTFFEGDYVIIEDRKADPFWRKHDQEDRLRKAEDRLENHEKRLYSIEDELETVHKNIGSMEKQLEGLKALTGKNRNHPLKPRNQPAVPMPLSTT